MLARKTVTALFCDVADSTGLGERLDPEAHRRVMARYFDEMRAVIERHGGTVEKFIGDAVMALFGVPQVREDDALRAVRAAVEMRQRLADVNEELDAVHGIRLAVSIGVNTGEVVTGGETVGGTLATGDAINVAARLQQAAGPNEILIGRATYPLVSNAITAGPLQRFRVKGKREEVATWRLDAVDANASGFARRLDAPLVDREAELRVLLDAFERAVQESGCRLVTMLGPAGIGKSRLVGELLAVLGERASALTGRCLPYGEGITFWPLVEMVRALGDGEQLDAVLAATADGPVIAERVLGAVGASPAAAPAEETFWAVRRLFEELARQRPLVVCVEDIHWAQPTFLDLLEYLVGWSRGAPILLVAITRPELLDLRPAWLSPRSNADVMSLEPLGEGDADTLVDTLRGDVELDAEARARIAAAAEGNPLFVEQMLALLAERRDAVGWAAVPPSIQALLAERLDRLAADERNTLERAAVVGREFPVAAVVELSRPELRGSVATLLLALARRGLVAPDTAASLHGDAYRFRHILIRDAAYAALPLDARADLHERFAEWLVGSTPGHAVEFGEIVGYHLEQAHTARATLGGDGDGDARRRLGARAAEHLTAAGRRALTRGDVHAAVNLLERAAALLAPDGVARAGVLLDLGVALREQGHPLRADAVLAEAETAAGAGDDERLRLRVLMERSVLRLYLDPASGAEAVLEVADRATPVFEAAADDHGLTRVWALVAEAHWMRSRFAAMEDVLERALAYAERAGDRRQASWVRGAMCRAALVGPRPVEDAIRRCTEVGAQAPHDPTLGPVVDATLATLEAMRGDVTASRERYCASRAALEELGLKVQLASLAMYAGWAELISGDAAAAERELRFGYDELERMGERSYLSTMAAFLAEAVHAQGRVDEAERLTVVSEESGSADDVATQVMWRVVRARVLAERGDGATAERLARTAVELAFETDFSNMQGDALVALARVLVALGRPAEAVEPGRAAVRLYDAKGNVVSSRATATFLASALTASSA